MILHYFQHVPFEGLGSIKTWAQSAGHPVNCTRWYAGDPPPALTDMDLLVVMGGPMNVYEESTYPWLTAEKKFIEQAVKADKPILGICLGAQLLATVMGARVYQNDQREIGWFDVFRTRDAENSRTAGFLPEKAKVFHWHGDTFEIPTGAIGLAQSRGCRHQGFVAEERRVGMQFHLEVTHEGAAGLIEQCRGDFEPPGPWVQDPAEILADRQRFKCANQLLVPLLDRLASLAP